MSIYIAVIQRINRACALYQHNLEPVSLELISRPISTSTPSPSPFLCLSLVSVTQIIDGPVIELLKSFVSSVIKDVLLPVTGLNLGKEEAFHERASSIH